MTVPTIPTKALAVDKSAQAHKRAKLRRVTPWRLIVPSGIVWIKGFCSSLVRAREPAENANAFGQIVASHSALYSQKVLQNLERVTKKLMRENARLLVHYEAAVDRVERIEAGMPALDTKGIYLRQLYRALAEREHLHNVKTAMKYSIALNLETLDSLHREAEAVRGKFKARAKGIIYQFMRGLSRGRTDLSLLSAEHIDDMLSKSLVPINTPDVSKYLEIINGEAN